MLEGLASESVTEVIARKLDAVAREHGVNVALAVDVGPIAMGFPSVDSERDCRFFFVRPLAQYQSLWASSEIIETPLDDEVRVIGWDLKRAVMQAVAGDPTVVEWLRSPLVYRQDAGFASALLDLYRHVANPDAARRHYLQVGNWEWDRSGARQGGGMQLELVAQALRSALALRWMRQKQSAAPPFGLPALMGETGLSEDALLAIRQLLLSLRVTSDLVMTRLDPQITRLMNREFLLAETTPDPVDEAAGVALAREVASAEFGPLAARFAPR